MYSDEVKKLLDEEIKKLNKAADAVEASIREATKQAKELGVNNSDLKLVAAKMYRYVTLARATAEIMKSDSRKATYALDKANIAVKKAGANAKVSSKDQNSTGFQVWVAKDKKFKKNVTKKTFKTNGKALKNKAVALKKGTNYIKVRAYTTIGGKTVYGAWSGIVKIKK